MPKDKTQLPTEETRSVTRHARLINEIIDAGSIKKKEQLKNVAPVESTTTNDSIVDEDDDIVGEYRKIADLLVRVPKLEAENQILRHQDENHKQLLAFRKLWASRIVGALIASTCFIYLGLGFIYAFETFYLSPFERLLHAPVITSGTLNALIGATVVKMGSAALIVSQWGFGKAGVPALTVPEIDS